MARVHQRKAMKDYPEHGIAKGDVYFYVKIKTGPRTSRVMRSKTPFKRSQLTQSEYLSTLFEWEEAKTVISSMEEAQQFADDIRTLGEDQDDKFNNMPEGLQQGDSGQMLEARRDACEQAASEIEDIVSEWEEAKTEWEAEIEAYKVAKAGYDSGDGSEEPELPENTRDNGDGAYEFDEDEFLDRVRDVSVDE